MKKRKYSQKKLKSSNNEQNWNSDTDSSNFAMSLAVGMATNNALLGWAAGGSLTGGILGDMMNPGGMF